MNELWKMPRIVAQDRAWKVPSFRRPRLTRPMAMDRAFQPLRSEMSQPLAMDRLATARRFSEDGHLHVVGNRISKATVNPYWGKEIPNYDKLGLDPDTKYMLLRHPKELERSAPTFRGKPILAEHIPVTSDDHPADLVIGSVGTDVRYEHPYLKSSLVFWPQVAIDAIEGEGQKELSCAYHYDPVMTPGVYEGLKYDGVMTNIRGNHVALVKDGRAGSDVVVQDAAFVERSKVMTPKMTPAAVAARGALFTYLTPRLAQDQKINLNPIIRGVTSKNYSSRKGMLVKAVQTAMKGKMAKDADIQDLANLLDALTPGVEQADAEVGSLDPNSAAPPMAKVEQDDNDPNDVVAKIKAYLEEQGVPPEILQNLDAFLAQPENPKPDLGDPAQEQPSEEPVEQPTAPPKESEDEGLAGPTAITGLDNDLNDTVVAVDPVNKPAIVGSGETPTIITSDEDEEDDENKPWAKDGILPAEQKGQTTVTKGAMDAAIQAAVSKAQAQVIRNQRNIRNAERYVRPWVGDLAMDAAQPADVYRATLKALGMDAAKVDKMHVDALVPVLEAQAKPSRGQVRQDRLIAADAKPAQSFAERFPDAGKITVQ